jgi:rubrerythrin
MPYSTLPSGSEGAKTFEKIYNDSLKEYNGDKGKAAQTAWAALKKQGYKKNPDSGKWEKSQLAEFSMTIVKASFDKTDQKMKFRAVASDTDPDLYNESMSPELFRDFVDRIENETPIPEPFKSVICEEDWCGGLPYPSIAHYKSAGGKNVPGEIDNVYVDGNRLKSTGILNDNELGRAVFKSLCEDLYKKQAQVDHNPVRVSIGFLDLGHSHVGQGMNYTFERKSMSDVCPMCMQGIGGKVYQKGVLVHEAFTRVPVNPRTEAEVMRAMTDEPIKTKKDDAASIVGELAESLVDKSLAGKDEVLTIKADGSMVSTNAHGTLTSDTDAGNGTIKNVNADAYSTCYDPNTGGWNQECIEQIYMGRTIPLRRDWQYNDADHRPDMDEGKTANTKPGAWKSNTDAEDFFAQFSVTKKESDGEHPASHYLVAEDNTKPSSWHLRVKDASGKINPRLLGGAHAALTKEYRGKPYGGPDKGKALAHLKTLYKTAGLKWPEEEKSIMETKGKIPEVPMMEGEEHREPFEVDEDELYPDVTDKETMMNPGKRSAKGFNSPTGEVQDVQGYGDMKVNGRMEASRKSKAKAYAGKETDAEEEMEDEEKGDGKKEKALVSAARSLITAVMNVKSQGITGDDALAAIQPLFNALGNEVKRSLTTNTYGTAELANIVRAAVAEATAPLAQEIAVLKAQNGGMSVNRSKATPQPRSINVSQFSQQVMKSQNPDLVGDLTGNLNPQKSQFAQIRQIAHKTVLGQ